MVKGPKGRPNSERTGSTIEQLLCDTTEAKGRKSKEVRKWSQRTPVEGLFTECQFKNRVQDENSLGFDLINLSSSDSL